MAPSTYTPISTTLTDVIHPEAKLQLRDKRGRLLERFSPEFRDGIRREEVPIDRKSAA